MKTNPKNYQRGVTLVEVLAVITVIVLVFLLILPSLAKSRRGSSRINCVNRLKQVAYSFQIWSSDNMDKYPMQVSTSEGGSLEFVEGGHTFPHFQAMSNEVTATYLLTCPLDMTRRNIATNFQNDFTDSKISYFIGVDASRKNPKSILVGDSHLAIGGVPVKSGLLLFSNGDSVGWTSARHDGRGNIALADGSVYQVNSSALRKALAKTGVATNRISIP